MINLIICSRVFNGILPSVFLGMSLYLNAQERTDTTTLPKEQKLTEVVVQTKRNKEVKTALRAEQKNALFAQESIGAQDLQRKSSSNAAEGLVRMSGITQVAQRGLYVRGLDDRYNSLTINDLYLGSPNPDNKIIPLELIPADIIKSISVFKTFNPSLHGDFVGATISIETKDYPQKKVFGVSLQTGFNTNTTFQDFKQLSTQDISSYFGYENHQRKLPEVYNEKNLDVYRATPTESKILQPTSWNNTNAMALPSLSFSFQYGDKKFLKHGKSIGYYLSLRFRNQYQTLRGVDRRLNSIGERLTDFNFISHSYETQKSGLATFSYLTGTGFSLTTTFIYINNSNNTTNENFGLNRGLTVTDFFSRDNSFEISSVWAGQLFATYTHPNQKHNFKLGTAFSVGQNDFPDRKLLRTIGQGEKAFYITENGIDPFVQYMSIGNREINAYIKYLFKINDHHNIEAGYDFNFTTYNLFNRVISLFYNGRLNQLPHINTDHPDQFFNMGFDGGYFNYQDPADPSKQVRINHSIHGLYVNYIFSKGRFEASAGLRSELTFRTIYYRDFKMSNYDAFLASRYNPIFFMPSVNLKYKATEKSNLRFTFSNTITRPRLREIIPIYYQDGSGSNMVGKEDLKFPLSYNVDVKYELFPTLKELFSFTVFGKYLENPIERIFVPIATGRSIQFNNFDFAYILGIEHEADLDLSRLFKSTALSGLSLGYNVTWMYTRVKIDMNKLSNQSFRFLTDAERPLQGASEWLFNADISYTKLIGQQWIPTCTLLFNTYSERIYAVGVEGANNVLEAPRFFLDIVLQNKIGNYWNVSFTIKNILDSPIFFKQLAVKDADKIDPTTYRTQQGIHFSVGLSYQIK